MLVIVAVSALTFMVVMAMALDFGNWYVHKHQLQNRVDAAAFAAGLSYETLFKACVASPDPALPTDPTNIAITQIAKDYAGIGTTYNASVNDPNKLTVKVNATDINTDDGSAGSPCAVHSDGLYWTNVTAREANITSFFAGLGVVAPTISANARVALMQASTASGMRPFVVANCVRAVFTNGTVDLAGSGTQWSGEAPDMPMNDTPVGIQVGCAATSPVYDGIAHVTRLSTGPDPQLTDLQFAATNQAANPCTNSNPYFIPRDGAACQMTVTATFSGTVQAAQMQIGSGAAQALSASGGSWTRNFTINPQSGPAPQGLQDITISARSSVAGPWQTSTAGIQAGNATEQGPIANVTLASHARPAGSHIGQITVTLRTLGANTLQVIDSGADCEPGGGPDPNSNISQMFQNGCSGPFAVKSVGATCEMNSTPYTCVRGITNGRLSTLVDDYDNRWAPSGTCTQNNWPGIQPGDPRLVTVFFTDTLPATQSASDEYPITGLGAFYVTGWDGAASSCGSSGTNGQNDPKPSGAPDGAVWGHYFKLVLPSADGTPGTAPCNPNDSAACIAVLVR